jgi:hypothetical protein
MAPDYGQPILDVPLIPPRLLRSHHVLEPNDSRFRAAARLLQALWREDRGLPIGTYTPSLGPRRRLGSRISYAAGEAGGNFMTPAVAAMTRREIAYREFGAMIDEARLFTNLLSSMPLVFNLFGPLRLDLALATRVVHLLCPDLKDVQVRGIRFEHSPGRRHPDLTSDSTAFDVFVIYTTRRSETGFIAVEVKYAETCQEPAPELRPRYNDLASTCGLFIEPSSPRLYANPLQQFFREHLLAQAMLMRRDYDEGRFAVIAPRLNYSVQNAISGYQRELDDVGPQHAGFASITLEKIIEAIAHAGEPDYARALFRRYCDWWLVDGEMELALEASSSRRPKANSPAGLLARGPLKLITGGRK